MKRVVVSIAAITVILASLSASRFLPNWRLALLDRNFPDGTDMTEIAAHAGELGFDSRNFEFRDGEFFTEDGRRAVSPADYLRTKDEFLRNCPEKGCDVLVSTRRETPMVFF